jgi:hypothetical protein
MQDTPRCQRCDRSNTTYYRHLFEGGYHVGVYCLNCRTQAQTGRAWYSKAAFSGDELGAMPTLTQLEHQTDPRQEKLF